MDNNRWNHVDRLLQSALDIPAVKRDAHTSPRVSPPATNGWKKKSVRCSPHTDRANRFAQHSGDHSRRTRARRESAATTAVRPAIR